MTNHVRRGWLCGLALLLAVPGTASGQDPDSRSRVRVVAIGDTGDEGGSREVATAFSSRVRADRTNALLFLGDNFYPRGLNVDDWEPLLTAVMKPFRAAIETVGPQHVHAVTGNHDYYSTLLLGFPMGFASLGNEREARQTDLWRYHYWWTDDTIVRSDDGTVGMQVVFLDSARPVAMGPQYTPDVFERLRAALELHRSDPGVQWRVIIAHHPLETVGEHGNLGKKPGFSRRIRTRLTGGQDTSSSKYRDYRRRVVEAIKASGARVNAFVAGHEHSLQLLNRPERDCAECPSVHVVSGAGSKNTAVAASAGTDYTPVKGGDPAESPKGFVELEASAQRLKFRFFGAGDNPKTVPMGPRGDVCEFALAFAATNVTTLACP